MGGCCCCSSKGTELNTPSAYYYYPRASEEHVPLSSGHGGASALSTGLLVDTNLDTSIPDTYRPPPAPMPYDVILGRPQTPRVAQEICNSKMDAAVQTTNSESFQQTVDGNTLENSAKSEDPKESECKVQIDFELDSAKGSEVELSKPVEPVIFASEEEDCPICLEGDVRTETSFNIFLMFVFASDDVNLIPLCLEKKIYVHIFLSSSLQSMMLRIQNLPPSVSIIFTLHAFLSGWKEVMHVLCVIRR